jgi:hypothetical protein
MPQRGRPKGSKNKADHKAGGRRKGLQYADEKQSQHESSLRAFIDRAERSKNSTVSLPPVPHPQCDELIKRSQELLQKVMEHPSMPKSRHFPDLMKVDFCQPTGDYDEAIDYKSDNEEDDDEKIKRFRQLYIPPPHSIKWQYLNKVKVALTKGRSINLSKGQKDIPPECNPLASGLGSRPVPDKFYKNISVQVWDPIQQYPYDVHQYVCPFCKQPTVEMKGWTYHPAFEWGKTKWTFYKRAQCKNNADCKGGRGKRRSFSTIDPRFIAILPTKVGRDFEWVFPAGGPGVHIDMQIAFSKLTNDHIRFSSFTSTIKWASKSALLH